MKKDDFYSGSYGKFPGKFWYFAKCQSLSHTICAILQIHSDMAAQANSSLVSALRECCLGAYFVVCNHLDPDDVLP
jgi:hypothetical protein